jgi:hypothetical protein
VNQGGGGDEADRQPLLAGGEPQAKRDVRFARSARGRDTAPDFWRMKRRSTMRSILWRGKTWRRPVGASCAAASNTSRFA